ncbi:MAG TPA: DNA polymerase V subunit UmuD [Succinivibrionaceae bacterium]|nr:DNA polymerase V subunit UmuD [Succinivibrionaceae bacterium]
MSELEVSALINKSLSTVNLPIALDDVAAGFPLPNSGQIDTTLDVNSYLLDHPQATVVFTVHGESMIEVGILPGDMVLVDTMKDVQDKDIVVASIDNEYTLKEFRKGPPLQLLPKNKNYQPIKLEEGMEVKLLDPVVSVIRKYI